MKTIYKYEIPQDKLVIEIKIPAGAKILTAAMQNGAAYLWAEVDTDKQLQTERFTVIGTGWEVPDWIREKTYISTLFDGSYVWHLFKVILK